MNPTSLLVALATVLFLTVSPQASEKPAKEPADTSKPTTKEPAPETSSPPVKKVVTDEAAPPVKKKPAPGASTPPVKKVVAAGTTQPVKKKLAPEGSTAPVKKVVADGTTPPAKKKPAPEGSTPPVKKKPGAQAAKEEFASILERCDENRDQAVTLAEFQKNQPAGKDPAAVEKWFQTRDSNRDGQLSKEDFNPAPSKKS